MVRTSVSRRKEWAEYAYLNVVFPSDYYFDEITSPLNILSCEKWAAGTPQCISGSCQTVISTSYNKISNVDKAAQTAFPLSSNQLISPGNLLPEKLNCLAKPATGKINSSSRLNSTLIAMRFSIVSPVSLAHTPSRTASRILLRPFSTPRSAPYLRQFSSFVFIFIQASR